MTQPAPVQPRVIGRYALFDEIASGGMATVHLGRLLGPAGFSRTVAIKRLHPQYAKDPDFVTMFLDEARLAARIQHPNVVATLDIINAESELFLVMELVQGESLSYLYKRGMTLDEPVPISVAVAIMVGVLEGLHAAHESKNEHGVPLGLVHRDVSPQNVMVGLDGVAKVLDFGVAKAAFRLQATREATLKGKLQYMAPEQVLGEVDRRSDVYSATVVLWELLARQKLFRADNDLHLLDMVNKGCSTPPSRFNSDVSEALDQVVMWGLAPDRSVRCPTALELATALERVERPATPREVREWVQRVAGERLDGRSKRMAEIESISSTMASHHGAHGPSEQAAPMAVAAPMSINPTASTSVSHITGLSQITRPSTGGNKALAAGLAALAVLSIVGVGAVLATRGGGDEGATKGAVGAASPKSAEPAASASPVVSAAPAAPAASSAAPAEVAPEATAKKEPPKEPTKKAAPPKGEGDSKPAPKAKSCDPPYVLVGGVKRYKPECL